MVSPWMGDHLRLSGAVSEKKNKRIKKRLMVQAGPRAGRNSLPSRSHLSSAGWMRAPRSREGNGQGRGGAQVPTQLFAPAPSPPFSKRLEGVKRDAGQGNTQFCSQRCKCVNSGQHPPSETRTRREPPPRGRVTPPPTRAGHVPGGAARGGARPSRQAPAAPAPRVGMTIQKMATFIITLITLVFVVVSGPAMHEA